MSKLKDLKFILLVVCTIVFTSCSDDEGNGPVTDNDYYISFRANGELVEMGFNQNGSGNSFQLSSSFTQISSSSGCYGTTSPGLVAINSNAIPQAGLSFYMFLEDFCIDSELFNTTFPVGVYEYSDSEYDNGVGFDYAPNQDDYYLTVNGDQTESTFEIISSKEDNVQVGNGSVLYRQIISGRFTCKIYNQRDLSDSIEITEGSFRVRTDAP